MPLTIFRAVLLSIENPGWKIADFGLTAEGNKKIAYSTRLQRGTPGYRAPEIIIEHKVTMKSDVWALGCILYELLSGEKAFFDDYKTYEYMQSNIKPIISFPESLDERLKSYLAQLVYNMLEIDWWKRPSTEDILRVLRSLFDGEDEIWAINKATGACRRWAALSSDHKIWKTLTWKARWYLAL
jgi:serine/threonine protein kinase